MSFVGCMALLADTDSNAKHRIRQSLYGYAKSINDDVGRFNSRRSEVPHAKNILSMVLHGCMQGILVSAAQRLISLGPEISTEDADGGKVDTIELASVPSGVLRHHALTGTMHQYLDIVSQCIRIERGVSTEKLCLPVISKPQDNVGRFTNVVHKEDTVIAFDTP
jgi:hypothetical protein